MTNNDQVAKAGHQLKAYCRHCGNLIAKQPYNSEMLALR